MSDDSLIREACEVCGLRPKPEPLGRGRRAVRCLACSRSAKADYRSYISRYQQAHGEEAARAMCDEQGVGYAGPAKAAATGPASVDPRRLAVQLFAADDDVPAALRAMGLPEGPESDELVAQARGYKGLLTGDSTQVGRLAYAVLVDAMLRLSAELKDLSPGALSQLIKPLTAVYQQYAGGTLATEIVIDFGPEPEE